MIAAWLRLAVVDLLVSFGGFPRLHRFMRGIAVRQTEKAATAEQVCRTLDRAAVHYPRELQCLKRSAAMTWLLRARGYPAAMMFGATVTPFMAHAWVELDGRVISEDERTIRGTYDVLDQW